ncbi:MAG: hypothetical protein ACOX08_00170, partial [Methanobacterium sp.]
LLSGPETALLGVMFAGAGIFEMLLGTEEVWSAVFMPTMTTKTYEEQSSRLAIMVHMIKSKIQLTYSNFH